MGQIGPLWLGIGFLFAGAATINTLMAGVPRILYGMAVDGALPKVFTYLHPRFKTPLLCILVAMLIPCLHALYLGGNTDNIMHLVLAAVCAWSFAYLLVTLSVVILRIRRPDLPRAYRSPWFPLPQIVSSIGILLGMWFITPPGMNPADIYVPFGVMLGVTATYALFWTLVVQKVNPSSPPAWKRCWPGNSIMNRGTPMPVIATLRQKLFELFRADRAPSGYRPG